MNKTNLPVLDLHGCKNIESTLSECISDFINLKIYKICIICSAGCGLPYHLNRNKQVSEYWIDPQTPGLIIVKLSDMMTSNDESKSKLSKSYNEIQYLEDEIEKIKKAKFESFNVTKIAVYNLFGLFNYNIDFNNNDVHVIHAPNVCVKSTFLKIIVLLFKRDFVSLKKMPFEKIEVVINGVNYIYNNGDDLHYLENVFKHVNINTEHLLIDNSFRINSHLVYNFKIIGAAFDQKIGIKNNRIEIFNSIMKRFFCYEKTVELESPNIEIVPKDDIINLKDQNSNLEKSRVDFLKIKYEAPNSHVPNTFKNGEIIEFENLSSGEQFIIKLFLKLIFDLKNGSLIMLDEPEISLHVEWQELLIESIYEISEQMGVKILIMTHSPYLLNFEKIEVGNVEYANEE